MTSPTAMTEAGSKARTLLSFTWSGEDAIDLLEGGFVQLEGTGLGVALRVPWVPASRDGRGHPLLLDDPPQSDCCHGRPQPLRDGTELVDAAEMPFPHSRSEELFVRRHAPALAASPVALVE